MVFQTEDLSKEIFSRTVTDKIIPFSYIHTMHATILLLHFRL